MVKLMRLIVILTLLFARFEQKYCNKKAFDLCEGQMKKYSTTFFVFLGNRDGGARFCEREEICCQRIWGPKSLPARSPGNYNKLDCLNKIQLIYSLEKCSI